MVKLTIVHGPGKGLSMNLEPGERIIGRAEGCDLTLMSNQVSKKHCVFQVDESGVTLTDAGSSNGTFVNGVLVKSKKLNHGDKVSVGDVTLEVSIPRSMRERSNVIPFKGVSGSTSSVVFGPQNGMPNTAHSAVGLDAFGSEVSTPLPPKTFKEKMLKAFEEYVLNFLYNQNERQEWRMLLILLFAFLCVGGAMLAVYPVMDRVTIKLEREAKGRAGLIARQMVSRNAVHVFEKKESNLDVSYAEREKGVISAYIVDLDGRIMAPARKANQYLTDKFEASFSASTREQFNKSLDAEVNFENSKDRDNKKRPIPLEEYYSIKGDSVFAAVPLRVFVQSEGRNLISAFGIVRYDKEMIMIDDATEVITYFQAIILMSLITVIVYFSVYRLTLKPLDHLNHEIDNVLKGNAHSITKKYQMEEISPLIDLVNITLQRAGIGNANKGTSDLIHADDIVGGLKYIADQADDIGYLILTSEKRVLHLNSKMDSLTNIHIAQAAGAEFAKVSNDESFLNLVNDLTANAVPGGMPSNDKYPFTDGDYEMACTSIGSGGFSKVFVITAKKIG